MGEERIRNIGLIASTAEDRARLARRLLEFTGALQSQEGPGEESIAPDARPLRLICRAWDGQDYLLNLLHMPSDVDSSYELSRSLAACEGALLVVDAARGMEAPALAGLYRALEQGLTIIPLVESLDAATARSEEVGREVSELLGGSPQEVLQVSAGEEAGLEMALEAIVEEVPPPSGDPSGPLRALVFGSSYDPSRGVVAYVRVMDGALRTGERLKLMSTSQLIQPLEVGAFAPEAEPQELLGSGEVGYIITDLGRVGECPVGDTITAEEGAAEAALAGFRPPRPLVFAGFYPAEQEGHRALAEALEEISRSDGLLTYWPEGSQALGPGFRCGSKGMLHLQALLARLEGEYDLELLTTAPGVECQVLKGDDQVVAVENPADLPPLAEIVEMREPWMEVRIFTPEEYVGAIMELVLSRRGEYQGIEYLDPRRVVLRYNMPLLEMIGDFYDQLKSSSRGHAFPDYSLAGYRTGDLVRLEILVNRESVDAFSLIVHRQRAYEEGSRLVAELKEVIPRQLFPIPIQASIGKRVVARETVQALRKNVLAKCYGGDVTRKRKLLERQKEGRKRLARLGNVEIPHEAFTAVLRRKGE